MAEFSIKINKKQEKRLRRSLRKMPAKIPVVIKRAVQKTVKTATVRLSRQIRDEITLNKTSVDERINVIQKPTVSNPSATIRVEGNPIPGLSSFKGVRQTKRGVAVRVRTAGGLEKHPHAFLAKGRGGKLQVFERKVISGQRVARKPLVRKLGPAPGPVLEKQPGLSEQALNEIAEVFEKNLLSQIDRVLGGKG